MKNDLIRIDLSDGWLDVLKDGVAINTKSVLNLGIDNRELAGVIYRNEVIMNKLKNRVCKNDRIGLFPEELKAVFWILIENMLSLQMKLEEVQDFVRLSKHLIDLISEEYGIDFSEEI